MDEILRPIKGTKLLNYLVSQGYNELLFPDRVSETVELALIKLNSFFDTKPEHDGENIWGISKIRTALFAVAGGYPTVNAFMITAPHTHWDLGQPVVYKFDDKNGRYIIGPHPIEECGIYLPVSFVFSQDQLLPYEWVDCSVKIDAGELETCIQILSNLNEQIFSLNLPLGVMIDFRFKSSLFDQLHSTVEFPANDEAGDFSYILKKNSTHQLTDSSPFDQVGWHPVSDDALGLNASEQRILDILRANTHSAEDLRDLI